MELIYGGVLTARSTASGCEWEFLYDRHNHGPHEASKPPEFKFKVLSITGCMKIIIHVSNDLSSTHFHPPCLTLSDRLGSRIALSKGKETEQLCHMTDLMVLLIGRRRPQIFRVSILLTFNLLLEERIPSCSSDTLTVSRGLRSPTCK